MEKLQLTVSDIKDLMASFQKNSLTSMKIQQGDFCLKFEAGREVLVAAPTPAAAAAGPAAPDDEPLAGTIVKSPIVGTFYASPAPDRDAYVKPGAKVKKGDVLFIIESMKLMNEVTSDYDGTVGEILVQNSAPVEFGQPILTII